jgi:hypothetical protein
MELTKLWSVNTYFFSGRYNHQDNTQAISVLMRLEETRLLWHAVSRMF